MKHENLTWENIEELIVELEIQIKHSKKKYDWIIGISRGGLIPSVLLSHKLNIPHGTYAVKSYSGQERKELNGDLRISMIGFIKPHHNILIVDDINDSGNSLKFVVEKIKYIDSDAKNLDTAVLYNKKKSIFNPTYFSKMIDDNTWLNFPWECKIEKDDKTL